MRKIRKIVIHCTDSPDDIDVGAREIREWHLQRGWSDIGYHYVIRRNGVVERGRSDDTAGAHVYGHNNDSLGVVWVGKKVMDPRQLQSLLPLIRGLMNQYDVEIDKVYGHYELDSNKTCPNLDMNWVRAELLFTAPKELP